MAPVICPNCRTDVVVSGSTCFIPTCPNYGNQVIALDGPDGEAVTAPGELVEAIARAIHANTPAASWTMLAQSARAVLAVPEIRDALARTDESLSDHMARSSWPERDFMLVSASKLVRDALARDAKVAEIVRLWRGESTTYSGINDTGRRLTLIAALYPEAGNNEREDA